jgi:hypothetical protein
MIHNELVLLVCFSTVDDMNHLIHVWSNLIHYKIIELQYQYRKILWVPRNLIFDVNLGSPVLGDRNTGLLVVCTI